MFLPEDNRIQTMIIQQIGTFKKRGRQQSSSEQKPKAFFVARKKKLISQQCVIEHTLSRVAPGEPGNKKASKRSCQQPSSDTVTLQVSKPQSQKIRTSGQNTRDKGYLEITEQLLRMEIKQGYLWGGQAKHWDSPLKQSFNVTELQTAGPQLRETQAWGPIHRQLRRYPRGSSATKQQQALSAGRAALPGWQGMAHGWHTKASYCKIPTVTQHAQNAWSQDKAYYDHRGGAGGGVGVPFSHLLQPRPTGSLFGQV